MSFMFFSLSSTMRMSSFATALFSCRLACHSLWFQALRVEYIYMKNPGGKIMMEELLAEKGRRVHHSMKSWARYKQCSRCFAWFFLGYDLISQCIVSSLLFGRHESNAYWWGSNPTLFIFMSSRLHVFRRSQPG